MQVLSAAVHEQPVYIDGMLIKRRETFIFTYIKIIFYVRETWSLIVCEE
jgi:hypothetical protein